MKTEGLLAEKEQERLDAHFMAVASTDTESEYWIHGSDEGQSYCRECAHKKVKELKEKQPGADINVDGGYGTEGDSTPFCSVCQKRLENTLTQYGCESELEHFQGNGFKIDSEDDCYSMQQVIDSSGWGPLEFEHESEHEKKERKEYYERLHSLGHKILADLKRFE